jgi:hypothetical protein
MHEGNALCWLLLFGDDACGALVLPPMRSGWHDGIAFREDRDGCTELLIDCPDESSLQLDHGQVLRSIPQHNSSHGHYTPDA